MSIVTKANIWVDGPRPDRVTLRNIGWDDHDDGESVFLPATHVANHPLISTAELSKAVANEGRKIRAVGTDIEGTLLKFGETDITDDVLSFLEDDITAFNIMRYAITDCRNREKVENWKWQLSGIGMHVYGLSVVKMDRPEIGPKKVTDKKLKKPNPVRFQQALQVQGISPEDAAYIDDKLKGTAGAMSAAYGMSVLTPRLGSNDHFADRLVTRREQIRIMNASRVSFPPYHAPIVASEGVVYPWNGESYVDPLSD